MHEPHSFQDMERPDHVCPLQRSLYGLKQAPRTWFQRFASYATRTIYGKIQSTFIITSDNPSHFNIIYHLILT